MSKTSTVILTSRVGNISELRHTTGGTAVVNVSLAQDDTYYKDNEEVAGGTWVPCVAWGSLAEAAAKALAVGDLVQVSGRFQAQKKDGERPELRVNLQTFDRLHRPHRKTETSEAEGEE